MQKRIKKSANPALIGQIVDIIRRDGIGFGERLYESRLAQRLGVSRPPVRQALQALSAQGLTKLIPHKGFILCVPLAALSSPRALIAADVGEKHYEAIARDHFDGQFPTIVSEAALMRRYHLTRAQLLRLLDRIAAEGWVERAKGYGWMFAQSLRDPTGNAQTARLRLIIEPAGILEPTFRWNPERMAIVRENQERVLRDGMRLYNLSEMFRFGCEFHEAIAECSGNVFLLDTLKRINHMRRLFAYCQMPDAHGLESLTREHLDILDVLETGDRRGAAALMKGHLLRSAGAGELAIQTPPTG